MKLLDNLKIYGLIKDLLKKLFIVNRILFKYCNEVKLFNTLLVCKEYN